MLLPPLYRKLLLALHLLTSVGWIGAVIAYLALGLAASATRDPEVVRATWIGMELIGWRVLLPLAGSSLVTGIAVALLSRWGLFRYYWVIFALVITALATLVLALHLPDVSATTEVVRSAEPASVVDHGGDLFHAGLAVGALVAVLLLNVYKPPGMTRYGWRRRQRQRTSNSAS